MRASKRARRSPEESPEKGTNSKPKPLDWSRVLFAGWGKQLVAQFFTLEEAAALRVFCRAWRFLVIRSKTTELITGSRQLVMSAELCVGASVESVACHDLHNTGSGSIIFLDCVEQAFPCVTSLRATFREFRPRLFWSQLRELELNVSLIASPSGAWPELPSLESFSVSLCCCCDQGPAVRRISSRADVEKLFENVVNPALRASRALKRISVLQEVLVTMPGHQLEGEQTMMDLIEARHAERLDLLALVLNPGGPLFPRVHCRKLQLGDGALHVYQTNRPRPELFQSLTTHEVELYELGTLSKWSVPLPRGTKKLRVFAELGMEGPLTPTLMDGAGQMLTDVEFWGVFLTSTEVSEFVKLCPSLHRVRTELRCNSDIVLGSARVKCTCQRVVEHYLSSPSLRVLVLVSRNSCMSGAALRYGRFFLDSEAVIKSRLLTLEIRSSEPESSVAGLFKATGLDPHFRSTWTQDEECVFFRADTLRCDRVVQHVQ